MSSLSPVAAAAIESCPANWAIDTNSREGISQLLEAKRLLGVNMVLEEGPKRYSNFSGELGASRNPGPGILRFEDVVLYGNTNVSVVYTVQVKECPGKKEFVIYLGTLKDELRISNINLNADPKTWAGSNQKYFTDFIKAEQFANCIAAEKKRISTKESIHSQILNGRLNIPIGFSSPASGGLCGTVGVSLFFADYTAGCRFVDEEESPHRRLGISIPLGKSCDVAIGAAVIAQEKFLVTIFDKFTIHSKDWKTKVTCVKGNKKKVFSSYYRYEHKVKCPAGYLRK